MHITSYSIRVVLLSRYVNIYDTMAPMSELYCLRHNSVHGKDNRSNNSQVVERNVAAVLIVSVEASILAAVDIFLLFFFFSLFTVVVVALALALGTDAFFLLPPFVSPAAVTCAVAVDFISFVLVAVVVRG